MTTANELHERSRLPPPPIDPFEHELEIAPHLAGASVTMLAVGGQGLLEDPFEGGGQIGTMTPQRSDLRFLHPADHLDEVPRSFVGSYPGQEFVTGHPEPKEIDPPIHPFGVEHLLRGHVEEFPLGPVRHQGTGERRVLGDPEIDEFHPPLQREEDVLRANVPMDEAGGTPVEVASAMDVIERATDRGPDLQDDRNGDLDLPPSAQPNHLVEPEPLDILHHDVVASLFPTEIVDMDDVRVVQEGQDPDLPEEDLPESFVLRVFGTNDLEGHLAADSPLPHLFGEQHLSHHTGADPFQDPEPSETGGGHAISLQGGSSGAQRRSNRLETP